MAMDAAYLHLIVRELQEHLLGASLTEVTVGDASTLRLGLRARRRQHHLVLSAAPSLSCLYLLGASRAGRAAPSGPLAAADRNSDHEQPFAQSLRRTLQGARMEAISQPPWERLVRLRFLSAASGLALEAIELIAELTGRHSNLVLVEAATGRILDCLRAVTPEQSRVRLLLRGETYAPPPAYRAPTLDELDAGALAQAWNFQPQRTPTERLKTSIAGLSPAMQRELLARARRQTVWSADEPAAVWAAAREMRQALEGPAQPRIYRRPDGSAAALAPFPLCAPPTEEEETHSSPSAAAERYYRELAAQQRLRGDKERLLSMLQQALEREHRKVEHLAEDVERCNEQDGCGRLGDLLLAHLHDIPAGAAAVELPAWDLSGAAPAAGEPPLQQVAIALDPSLTAVQNAERYYDRQRKVRRALPILAAQLSTSRQRLAELAAVQRGLREAATPAEVQSIADAGETQALLPELQRRRPAGKARQAPKHGVRHYRTRDGWDILVGAHSRGNDYLMTKIAREHDVWLHAQGSAGSHVVIRNPTKIEKLPDSVIEQAARLAAHFSKAHHQARVDVIVTSRRYVKKRKGMPPGMVTVEKHDTITLAPRPPEGAPQPELIESS
ncbi:MAG: NFACT family protein [Candidatus Tectomicrobia bacterium]|nr:NFACT family protein [Candidatus Tectomicrobia bacterium]